MEPGRAAGLTGQVMDCAVGTVKATMARAVANGGKTRGWPS
jgi:hypothetical protein